MTSIPAWQTYSTDVDGLYYIPDIISSKLTETLVKEIDSQPWSKTLARRTQHYGYEYNYSSQGLTPAPCFPEKITVIKTWLAQNIFTPDQCIVNEYLKTQGIGKHIDSKNFGPIIASVSLLQPTNMIFRSRTTYDTMTLTLESNSMVILTGVARYDWYHEIPKRKTVTLANGEVVTKAENYRRLSLTFRSTN